MDKSARRMDLTGHRYGILTVIREEKQIRTKRRWLCQCDCGNKTIVKMDSLRSGNTKSCGCIKPINVSKGSLINITGKKYGKLTVIKRVEKETELLTSFWLCKCDCGNEVVVSSSNLRNNHTRSCGCLKKGPIKNDVTKESCLNDMINIYKKHGKINQHKLNSKLPGYSLMTLRRRFGGIKVDKIWEIVENEILEEKENEND